MSRLSGYGFAAGFRPGDYDRVEAALPQILASGATYLRMDLPWADYHAPGGADWYEWLLPRLGAAINLLPCLYPAPPAQGRAGLGTDADFIDLVLTRHGENFTHLELWSAPGKKRPSDPAPDPFENLKKAARQVRTRGWAPVLGGLSPFDPNGLEAMGRRGLLAEVSAIGFCGFPGTWDGEADWQGWAAHLGEMRAILERHNPGAEIWITETGYSTWRHDEMEQACRFLAVLDAGAGRVYWKGWRDLAPDMPAQDPRDYHLGVVEADNRPKLLARLLSAGGAERVEQVTRLASPRAARGAHPVVITGGSGFIGCNLADSYLSDGHEVIVLDNFSRPGVEENLAWLSERHGARVHPAPVDLRDERALGEAVRDAAAVVHLAAQTAVTTSLEAPMADFEVNARGTLNLLEAVRATGRQMPVIFASTNKVYGALEDLEMVATEDGYLPVDADLRGSGVGEDRGLDFCTPYGCSKGVADQYVLDYAKSYGLPSAVLRMSCIYGPRQFGTEDQGWVAHFLIRALKGQPISIFGDGRQVRDVLHVDDAVAAYRAVHDRIGSLSHRVFNLGGGPRNAVSLLTVLREIERITGRAITVEHHEWRQGDQFYFVADSTRLQAETGWEPRVGWREGIAGLAEWLAEHRVHRPLREPERIRA